MRNSFHTPFPSPTYPPPHPTTPSHHPTNHHPSHHSDTGYRAVPSLPATENDYAPHHTYPHCPAFAQIGALRGPFDLGLIPIGAYDPRWIMSPMHANPFDSVNIFLDTRCRRAMGIHWGTWVLTEEDVLEPPRLLRDACRWKGLPETGRFDVCEIGESREF